MPLCLAVPRQVVLKGRAENSTRFPNRCPESLVKLQSCIACHRTEGGQGDSAGRACDGALSSRVTHAPAGVLPGGRGEGRVQGAAGGGDGALRRRCRLARVRNARDRPRRPGTAASPHPFPRGALDAPLTATYGKAAAVYRRRAAAQWANWTLPRG